MRRAARIDKTHQEIVKALRGWGATVESLATVGGGTPDLLVGINKVTVLMEVKSGKQEIGRKGQLNDLQQEWHSKWRGGSVVTVWCVEDALRAIGVRV